jgi:hypothetical protein
MTSLRWCCWASWRKGTFYSPSLPLLNLSLSRDLLGGCNSHCFFPLLDLIDLCYRIGRDSRTRNRVRSRTQNEAPDGVVVQVVEAVVVVLFLDVLFLDMLSLSISPSALVALILYLSMPLSLSPLARKLMG